MLARLAKMNHPMAPVFLQMSPSMYAVKLTLLARKNHQMMIIRLRSVYAIVPCLRQMYVTTAMSQLMLQAKLGFRFLHGTDLQMKNLRNQNLMDNKWYDHTSASKLRGRITNLSRVLHGMITLRNVFA